MILDEYGQPLAGGARHLYADQAGQEIRDPEATPTRQAWTTQKTWVTGEVLTASDLNTYLRDNSNYLYQRPAAQVNLSGTQSIASSVFTDITFAAAFSINSGAVPFPARGGAQANLLVPESGTYMIVAYLTFAAAGGSSRILELLQDGGLVAWNAAPASTNVVNAVGVTGAGGTSNFKAQGWQDSGAGLNVTGGTLSAVRVG